MLLILESPIVARVHSNKDPDGNTSAELFFNPSSVIHFSVFEIMMPSVPVISVGVHQGIIPFQYDGTDVEGVPPLTIYPKSSKCLMFQSSGTTIFSSSFTI